MAEADRFNYSAAFHVAVEREPCSTATIDDVHRRGEKILGFFPIAMTLPSLTTLYRGQRGTISAAYVVSQAEEAEGSYPCGHAQRIWILINLDGSTTHAKCQYAMTILDSHAAETSII